MNQCKYFRTKNIQRDETDYDIDSLSSRDEPNCGLTGKYVEQDVNVEFKLLLYSFARIALPLTLLILILIILNHIYLRVLNEKYFILSLYKNQKQNNDKKTVFTLWIIQFRG